MSNVISFPQASYIEIWCGRLKESPNRFSYFLDLVEPDGGRQIVHEDETHEGALYWAQEWKREGLRIVDKTGGAQ